MASSYKKPPMINLLTVVKKDLYGNDCRKDPFLK